jgi:signal peptidase I
MRALAAVGRLLRRCAAMAAWAVAGLGVGIALAAVGPYAIGARSFTVLSGSMEPTIHTGDVVVVRSIPPLEARIGDVVTFRDPEDNQRLITHRLRKVHVSGGTVEMVTKGDANNTTEHWTVSAGGRIGKVQYRIPYIGRLFNSLRGRSGGLFLLLIPVVLLGLYELVRLWRPERPDGVKREPPMPIDNCAE